MKRSVRTAIAATALAGSGLLAVAPVALAYPTPDVVAVIKVNGIVVTIVTTDGSFDPGSFVKYYGLPAPTQSAVRSALLASPSHVSRVSSFKSAIPANAIFLGTGQASASGSTSAQLTMPTALQNKKVEILVVGVKDGAPVTVSTVVTVGGAGTGGLPFTGSSNLIPMSLAGLGALAVGSGIVIVARRRRTEAVPA